MAKHSNKQNESNNVKNQNLDQTIRPSGDISINSDVLGSYTGVTDSEDPYERPIQDADDL